MKSTKVLVSACLLGEKCRYDGDHCFTPKIQDLIQDFEVIVVCPEVRSGLSVPREPVEIFEGKVLTREGKDLTSIYKKGVDLILEDIKDEEISLAILKSKSPTCGSHQIYDGTFSGRLINGNGLLAKALRDRNIQLLELS